MNQYDNIYKMEIEDTNKSEKDDMIRELEKELQNLKDLQNDFNRLLIEQKQRVEELEKNSEKAIEEVRLSNDILVGSKYINNSTKKRVYALVVGSILITFPIGTLIGFSAGVSGLLSVVTGGITASIFYLF